MLHHLDVARCDTVGNAAQSFIRHRGLCLDLADREDELGPIRQLEDQGKVDAARDIRLLKAPIELDADCTGGAKLNVLRDHAKQGIDHTLDGVFASDPLPSQLTPHLVDDQGDAGQLRGGEQGKQTGVVVAQQYLPLGDYLVGVVGQEAGEAGQTLQRIFGKSVAAELAALVQRTLGNAKARRCWHRGEAMACGEGARCGVGEAGGGEGEETGALAG